jgi:voltage-gated potassium channel Kch
VVATDGRETTDRIVDLIQAEFPNARLFVRAFDRGHTLSLKARNVEFEIRETYESALAFGRATLIGLGLDPDAASDLAEQVRQRDRTRLALQEAGGIMAGSGAMLTEPSKPTEPTPEPLIEPKRPSRALNSETENVARAEKVASGNR